MISKNLVQGGDAGRWDQAIYAFLAEKERRSGSMRTVRAYSGMLYRFFGTLGKPPDQVTATEVFGYAHGTGLSGKKALVSHHRSPHRLPESILPLPHPYEPGEREPVRPA